MGKSVGFAPEPQEVTEIHERKKQQAIDDLKTNPFHKLPPELAHLEKRKPGPKPLPTQPKPQATPSRYAPLGDLRFSTIKDISVQNKQTELNFNYPEIDLFLPNHKILVNVKYGGLNSYDLAKINKYNLNVSNVKVGLGYEFSGEVLRVGKNYESSPDFAPGTKVVGIVNPSSRKGSLSSSLLLDPASDVVLPLADELQKLDHLDPSLSFEKSEPFGVDDSEESSETSPETSAADTSLAKTTPLLAKTTVFPLLYCRLKQALSHVDKTVESTGKLSLLINGADSNLGYTIVQLLQSSVYTDRLQQLDLILVVRESSYESMLHLVEKLRAPALHRISLLTFDMINEDLVLPGEKVPVNYKKIDFFASEVLEKMFDAVPDNEKVTKNTVDNYKLDGIIDIVGSKKYFQTLSVRFSKLDDISLPFQSKILEGTSLKTLFNGSTKEPFLMKILKPKAQGSSFVSMCKLSASEPSYLVDKLYDYSGNEGMLNLWSSKWTADFANLWLGKYNYYDETELKTKKQWVVEGLRVFTGGEIKFKINYVVDWRKDFKKYVRELRKADGKVVFEIEDF